MHIACSSWTFRNYDVLSAIKFIKEAGFEYAELWGDRFHLDPRNKPAVRDIRRNATSLGIKIQSIHAPFSEHEGLTLTRDKRQREWVRLVKETIKLAAKLEAELVIVHPRIFFEYPEFLTSCKAYWDTVGMYNEICAHADAHGLKVALENMHGLRGQYFCRHLMDVKVVLEDLASSNAGVCLDLCHAVFNGEHILRLLQALGSRILVIHASDNNSMYMEDPHLIPGDGLIDWQEVFATLRSENYSGTVTLEVAPHTDPRASVREAKAAIDKYLGCPHSYLHL